MAIKAEKIRAKFFDQKSNHDFVHMKSQQRSQKYFNKSIIEELLQATLSSAAET